MAVALELSARTTCIFPGNRKNDKEYRIMDRRQAILLIDDDQEYCRTMQKLFERRGYEIFLAADGQEALDIISDQLFDLVLSDLRMPNLDGIELMAEIKRRKISVPVIFVTGYGEVESYMDLMNMGAFDYLNKPIDPKELFRVVETALETGVDEHCAF